MMFYVTEHIERDLVLDVVAKRPCNVMCTVAVVVHRPHSEERSQTLPDRHGNHVVLKHAAVPDAEYQHRPRRGHQ